MHSTDGADGARPMTDRQMDRQIDRYMVLCLRRQEVSESQTWCRVGRFDVDRLGEDESIMKLFIVATRAFAALIVSLYLAWLHVFFLVILSRAAWPLPESCFTMFCKPFCDLRMYRITEGDRGVAHCNGWKEGFCRIGIISGAPMSPVESFSLLFILFRRGL